MADGDPRPEPSTPEPDHHGGDSNAVPSLPPPPVPATDPRLQLQIASAGGDVASPTLAAQEHDVFRVSPQAALKVLSAGIEALVSMTGDVPPTPPPMSPALPHMRGMDAEKKSIVRSNSEKSLARLAQQRSASNSQENLTLASQLSQRLQKVVRASQQADAPAPSAQPTQPVDGVHLREPKGGALRPPPAGDAPRPAEPLSPYIIVGENSQPLNLQHSAITRKFYCRVPPPISITDYLLRIHHYCPMSTGVYLATSLYIHRLAVVERAIVVTTRNAHRLLLAGLRVAMKALEDLSYPHGRFARVGGVSERELSRLEISFCFLTGFQLAVDMLALTQHWDLLRRGSECWSVLDDALPHDGPFVSLQQPPGGGGDIEAQA